MRMIELLASICRSIDAQLKCPSKGADLNHAIKYYTQPTLVIVHVMSMWGYLDAFFCTSSLSYTFLCVFQLMPPNPHIRMVELLVQAVLHDAHLVMSNWKCWVKSMWGYMLPLWFFLVYVKPSYVYFSQCHWILLLWGWLSFWFEPC